MYVARCGARNSNFDLEVTVANSHSEIMAAKTARDAGREGFTPLTEVLDFVTITDPDKFGPIVSWTGLYQKVLKTLSLKLDQASGEYFDFKYDEKFVKAISTIKQHITMT